MIPRRMRQRCHNSVQMHPDTGIVTQQTSGPHVLFTNNSWLSMTSTFPPATNCKIPSSGARTLTLQYYFQGTEKSLHITSPPTNLVKTSTGSWRAELGTQILYSYQVAEKQHTLHRVVLIARQDRCLHEH